jgi:hypothetical protein
MAVQEPALQAGLPHLLLFSSVFYIFNFKNIKLIVIFSVFLTNIKKI